MFPSPDIIRDFSRLQAECRALGESNVLFAQEIVRLREALEKTPSKPVGLTKLEILEENRAAYSNPANRAINNDYGCEYLTEDGRMCGIGRCMKEPGLFHGFIHCLSLKANYLDADPSVVFSDRLLKPKYHGHSMEFWNSIQMWHDSNDNFTKTEISEEGERAYQKLVERWCK